MTIYNKIKDEKLQYDIKREVGKIPAFEKQIKLLKINK